MDGEAGCSEELLGLFEASISGMEPDDLHKLAADVALAEWRAPAVPERPDLRRPPRDKPAVYRVRDLDRARGEGFQVTAPRYLKPGRRGGGQLGGPDDAWLDRHEQPGDPRPPGASEWQVPDPTDPDSVVDPATRREILRIDEPQFNHDAGTLVFGPDGFMYVSLGDGGAADDQGVGHVPGGNGQDPSNVLGSILRIDPLGNDSANGQYGIPDDNPFVGDDSGADEGFAFGFRNPYRISFDSEKGTLFAADVGQNDIEEVNVVVAGGNYGWPLKEGSACFDRNGTDPGFAFAADPCPGTAGLDLIDPVAEYDHDDGIAVVGFVYRGSEIRPLKGRYVFGDFFSPADGRGRLFQLATPNAKPAGVQQSIIREPAVDGLDGTNVSVLGFGQDASGELYLLTNQTGTPFGDTGAIHKITLDR